MMKWKLQREDSGSDAEVARSLAVLDRVLSEFDDYQELPAGQNDVQRGANSCETTADSGTTGDDPRHAKTPYLSPPTVDRSKKPTTSGSFARSRRDAANSTATASGNPSLSSTDADSVPRRTSSTLVDRERAESVVSSQVNADAAKATAQHVTGLTATTHGGSRVIKDFAKKEGCVSSGGNLSRRDVEDISTAGLVRVKSSVDQSSVINNPSNSMEGVENKLQSSHISSNSSHGVVVRDKRAGRFKSGVGGDFANDSQSSSNQKPVSGDDRDRLSKAKSSVGAARSSSRDASQKRSSSSDLINKLTAELNGKLSKHKTGSVETEAKLPQTSAKSTRSENHLSDSMMNKQVEVSRTHKLQNETIVNGVASRPMLFNNLAKHVAAKQSPFHAAKNLRRNNSANQAAGTPKSSATSSEGSTTSAKSGISNRNRSVMRSAGTSGKSVPNLFNRQSPPMPLAKPVLPALPAQLLQRQRSSPAISYVPPTKNTDSSRDNSTASALTSSPGSGGSGGCGSNIRRLSMNFQPSPSPPAAAVPVGAARSSGRSTTAGGPRRSLSSLNVAACGTSATPSISGGGASVNGARVGHRKKATAPPPPLPQTSPIVVSSRTAQQSDLPESTVNSFGSVDSGVSKVMTGTSLENGDRAPQLPAKKTPTSTLLRQQQLTGTANTEHRRPPARKRRNCERSVSNPAAGKTDAAAAATAAEATRQTTTYRPTAFEGGARRGSSFSADKSSCSSSMATTSAAFAITDHASQLAVAKMAPSIISPRKSLSRGVSMQSGLNHIENKSMEDTSLNSRIDGTNNNSNNLLKRSTTTASSIVDCGDSVINKRLSNFNYMSYTDASPDPVVSLPPSVSVESDIIIEAVGESCGSSGRSGRRAPGLFSPIVKDRLNDRANMYIPAPPSPRPDYCDSELSEPDETLMLDAQLSAANSRRRSSHNRPPPLSTSHGKSTAAGKPGGKMDATGIGIGHDSDNTNKSKGSLKEVATKEFGKERATKSKKKGKSVGDVQLPQSDFVSKSAISRAPNEQTTHSRAFDTAVVPLDAPLDQLETQASGAKHATSSGKRLPTPLQAMMDDFHRNLPPPPPAPPAGFDDDSCVGFVEPDDSYYSDDSLDDDSPASSAAALASTAGRAERGAAAASAVAGRRRRRKSDWSTATSFDLVYHRRDVLRHHHHQQNQNQQHRQASVRDEGISSLESHNSASDDNNDPGRGRGQSSNGRRSEVHEDVAAAEPVAAVGSTRSAGHVQDRANGDGLVGVREGDGIGETMGDVESRSARCRQYKSSRSSLTLESGCGEPDRFGSIKKLLKEGRLEGLSFPPPDFVPPPPPPLSPPSAALMSSDVVTTTRTATGRRVQNVVHQQQRPRRSRSQTHLNDTSHSVVSRTRTVAPGVKTSTGNLNGTVPLVVLTPRRSGSSNAAGPGPATLTSCSSTTSSTSSSSSLSCTSSAARRVRPTRRPAEGQRHHALSRLEPSCLLLQLAAPSTGDVDGDLTERQPRRPSCRHTLMSGAGARGKGAKDPRRQQDADGHHVIISSSLPAEHLARRGGKNSMLSGQQQQQFLLDRQAQQYKRGGSSKQHEAISRSEMLNDKDCGESRSKFSIFKGFWRRKQYSLEHA